MDGTEMEEANVRFKPGAAAVLYVEMISIRDVLEATGKFPESVAIIDAILEQVVEEEK